MKTQENAVKDLIKSNKFNHEKSKTMINKKMKLIREVMQIAQRDSHVKKGTVYWQNKYVDLENIVLDYIKDGIEEFKMKKTREHLTDVDKYISKIDDEFLKNKE